MFKYICHSNGLFYIHDEHNSAGGGIPDEEMLLLMEGGVKIYGLAYIAGKIIDADGRVVYSAK